MSTKPTLVVLAAGMGSRYGGLKQVDPVGPHGELIIDYSVYDALRAGFAKVVFVIRREIEADFRACIGSRFEGRVATGYVYQELDRLPAGHAVPPGRVKPWGTGHAVWMARDAVHEPFGVINADDFYGRHAYAALAGFLRTAADTQPARYAMVGFVMDKTLSEHGHVARGLCVHRGGTLASVTEITHLVRTPDGARGVDPAGQPVQCTGQELVSMNLWGFTPSLFPHLEREFAVFLAARGQDAKSEFYLPGAVSSLIEQRAAEVAVLSTPDRWFGVTYREDKAAVQAAVRELIRQGVYPEALWA